MSDNPAEANVPAVLIQPSPRGGLVGVMHLGDTVRSFVGANLDRMRTLVSKVGIAEFRMSQADADNLAAGAVDAHADAAAEGQSLREQLANAEAAIADLKQQAENLEGASGDLSKRVAELEADNGALQVENEKLQTEIDALQADLGKAQSDHAAAQEQVEQLTAPPEAKPATEA